jgi:biopolymer transport protein ExbB
MNETGTVGLMTFWAQADAVGKSTALLLLVMSLATWYLILSKALQVWRMRREADLAQHAFRDSGDIAKAVARMKDDAPQSPFTSVTAEGIAARAHYERHARSGAVPPLDLSEFMTRALRRAMQRAASGMDSGLSILASVGATAPFIGLFGTVWGIYHALIGIGFTGQASLDKVAGPVGEALIMTAFGIAVAIPAVLAYNFFLRSNRVLREDLDGFAQDLHAYFMMGSAWPTQASSAVTAGSQDLATGKGY